MYTDEQLMSISALQHLMFCPRQCGLIHLEQCWEENALTAQGRIMHEKAHSSQNESRVGLRIVRSLHLRSYKLGLTGVADVVEFHKSDSKAAIQLENIAGLWLPKIVEYKRGKPKKNRCDEIQLCAQALCLEEMLGCYVDESELFYGQKRQRHNVCFDDELRELTIEKARQLHGLLDKAQTPKAEYCNKCKSCSLYEICMPKSAGKSKSVARYISRSIKHTLTENGEVK